MGTLSLLLYTATIPKEAVGALFVVMPVPDLVQNDVSGIQGIFLYMNWFPAFAGMTGTK